MDGLASAGVSRRTRTGGVVTDEVTMVREALLARDLLDAVYPEAGGGAAYGHLPSDPVRL